MVKRQHLFLRALTGTLCLALAGCSGETTTNSSTTQATPSVTATVAEGTQADSEVLQANGGASSATSSSNASETDPRVIQTIKLDPNEKNELTQMKVEPGTERHFQNGLNEAELAYRKARNEKKQKARREAAEQRSIDIKSGNGAPVFDSGGLTEVRVQ